MKITSDETLRFDDQVVVITGGGGGLGACYAQLLASRGAIVVVNDLGGDVHGTGGDHGPADVVVDNIKAAGGKALANYDSVATPAGGAAIIEQTMAAFGRVDAIVHNAGILRDKSILKLTPEDLDTVFDVHLKGAFHLAQPAFRVMKEQNFGRIVFTSSGSGLFGNFGQSNYGAAKTGLVGLMRVLSIEGARYDVRVNCVSPSARTRMTESLLGPLSDTLEPNQVAPLVALLCSRQCDFTSEIFSAGGGRFARVFLGLTQGWYSGGGAPATPEMLAEHMQQIFDTTGFTVPQTGMDELEIMLETFGKK